MTESIRTSPF